MKPSPHPASSARAPQKHQPTPAKSGGLLAFGFLILAIGTSGLAWWEHGRIGELESQLSDAQMALEKDRKAHTAQLAEPVAPVVQFQPDTAPDPATEARQRGAAFAGAIGTLLNNPQVQQLAAGMARNMTSSLYSGLVQELNLSAEQAATFNDLVAQRALVGQEVLRNATAQGADLTANAPALRQQVTQAQAQVDTQIQGLLGDGGYQRYQDYSRNLQQQLGGGGGLGAPGGN